MSSRHVEVLALLLHNEFCTDERCAGAGDYMESARRLLPLIDQHINGAPTETHRNVQTAEGATPAFTPSWVAALLRGSTGPMSDSTILAITEALNDHIKED